MKLKTEYLLRNDCYKPDGKLPRPALIHSTATPGASADSFFKSWKKSFQAGEMNRQVCVHAFVDNMEVLQCLPWNYRARHCGVKANDTQLIGMQLFYRIPFFSVI